MIIPCSQRVLLQPLSASKKRTADFYHDYSKVNFKKATWADTAWHAPQHALQYCPSLRILHSDRLKRHDAEDCYKLTVLTAVSVRTNFPCDCCDRLAMIGAGNSDSMGFHDKAKFAECTRGLDLVIPVRECTVRSSML